MQFVRKDAPEDLKQETLSDYDMHQLDDLKRFIWDARVKARKARARGEKVSNTDNENSRSEKEKELKVKAAQPSFF
jgi:CO dehydrogenase/acetyl-CoA synthase beta subunit